MYHLVTACSLWQVIVEQERVERLLFVLSTCNLNEH